MYNKFYLVFIGIFAVLAKQMFTLIFGALKQHELCALDNDATARDTPTGKKEAKLSKYRNHWSGWARFQ